MDRSEYYKKYREKNEERIREYDKRYYEKNKDRLRENQERWLKNNPNWKKEYYQKNKEKLDNKNKNWQKNNKKRFTELCNQSRKRRVERLREEGVKNPWAVVNKGAEPRYENNNNQES